MGWWRTRRSRSDEKCARAPHGPARHRRRTLRLRRRRVRPRAGHRDPRRRPPDGVLARPDADRHVPPLGAGLAPRRAAASTPSRRTSRTAACDPADHDPIPIGVFLDHTDWFREQKGLDVDERLVDVADEAQRRGSSRRWRTARRSRPTRCSPRPASGTSSTCRRGRGGARATPGAHLRPRRLRRPGRRAGRRHRRAAERLRVGGAALRPRGGQSVDVVHRHAAPAFEGSAGHSSTPTSSRPWRTAAGGAACRRRSSRPSPWSSGRSAG